MTDDEERLAFVEACLGDAVICLECGTDLAGYRTRCMAALNEWCPGFEAIERAEKVWNAEHKARQEGRTGPPDKPGQG